MSADVRILVGHVLDQLAALPPDSVHICVTSPPYWGLRAYGTDPQVWGGEADCAHVWGDATVIDTRHLPEASPSEKQSTNVGSHQRGVKPGQFCQACGAWRGELGLEPTPSLHIAHLLAVFREVRRVLRPDGTLWLNYGDCYASSPNGRSAAAVKDLSDDDRTFRDKPFGTAVEGLKPKDLVMMPERLAIALQADGWWVRSRIIWHKPNPMPSSVTDRPGSSHEHLWMLSKRASYFYDGEAVRVAWADDRHGNSGTKSYAYSDESGRKGDRGLGKPLPHSGRNLRDVWTIPTAPYAQAHFACVDAETKALTKSGWRGHDELSDGDEIAAFLPERNCLVWQPAQLHRYPFSGRLVRVEKRDSSQRLTENHRCLVRRRTSGVGVVLAGDLKPGMEIRTVAPLVVESSAGPGPHFAALLGWYLTEGERRRHNIIRINQSSAANPQHVETIRALLVELGADFTEHNRPRQWRGRCADMVVFNISGAVADRLTDLSADKAIDLAWLAWPPADIQALIDAMIAGDGHTRADGRRCLIQKDRVFIESAQILALRLGLRGHISKRAGGSHALYLTAGEWLTLRDTNGAHTPISREDYSGVVWCPTVASTFWLAMRAGRTFVTGNTFPPALVEPCIKAGTSEKGCCPACAAPWLRVVEKSGGTIGAAWHDHDSDDELGQRTDAMRVPGQDSYSRKTTGWRPTCDCPGNDLTTAVPATVLDPFGGAGTTGLVARRLGRAAVLIELNDEYAAMADARIRADGGRVDSAIEPAHPGPLFQESGAPTPRGQGGA